MFGERPLPKPNIRVRPKPVTVDVNIPGPQPYTWGHMGRCPNTDYPVKLMQYKQKKKADYIAKIEGLKGGAVKDLITIKYDRHAEKRRFQIEIEKRVEKKMQDYEDAIDRRREKLRELMAEEERVYYKETIDTAQRGGETRMETMKKQAEILAAKRESERLQIVKQKRLQQYMLRCTDMRETVAKTNLIESKNIQLQQIRENEARREAEREVEALWHDMSVKEMQAKREREEYDEIAKYYRNKGDVEVWDTQVQAKELLKAEMQRISEEDRVEFEKLKEKMKQEDVEAAERKQKKRDLIDMELKEQIKVQQKFLEQRRKEEEGLEQAFTLLAQMELDRERSKVVDSTSVAKREMAQYRSSLEELKKQREIEEKILNELLEEHKIEIQRKQDEARCKIEAAKRKLQKDVLEERAEQISYKKELAKEQLKLQQADNEMMRFVYEANERLAAETARQEKLAREQYRDDLIKQIEYTKVLQERERVNLERQLEVGRQEEERYQKLVKDICSGEIKFGQKHPFRRVIERYDCSCPPIEVNPPK